MQAQTQPNSISIWCYQLNKRVDVRSQVFMLSNNKSAFGMFSAPRRRKNRVKEDNKFKCCSSLYSEAKVPQPQAQAQVKTLLRRFWKVAAPYWYSDDKLQGRLQLAAVFALTLATTGISVGFNFLGRDFYNALASQSTFSSQLIIIYVFIFPFFFFEKEISTVGLLLYIK